MMKIAREGVVVEGERTICGDGSPVEFLHSGSVCLNLAGSNKGQNGGWARGRIINLVGDGSSGKTLLALELAARCFYKVKQTISNIYPPVKSVRIRYINAEKVMDFPIAQMYGKQFEDGVEWVNDIDTVEDMGNDIGRTIKEGKSGQFLLYVVDSLDALTSKAAKKRFEDAVKSNKEEDGSYGTEKAKYLSSFFGHLCGMMDGKDVTVVVISQIRQKIGVTFGEKYMRAGGKSLDFYTHQVCWLSEMEKLKRTVMGEDRVYGIRVLARFKRNKVAKPFREAELTILFDYGLDDLSTSLAWLYGPKVRILSFDGIEYSRPNLIVHIEQNGLESKLSEMVVEKWNSIEDALKPDRKEKF